jgi:hypothetical protein
MVMVVVVGVMVVVVVGLFLVGLLLVGLLLVELFLVGLLLVGLFLVGLLLEGLFLVGLLLEGLLWLKELEQVGKAVPVVARDRGLEPRGGVFGHGGDDPEVGGAEVGIGEVLDG